LTITKRHRGRPPRDLQAADEWAEICRVFQRTNCLRAEQIEEILGVQNPTGQTWRSWCAASRTPSESRKKQVMRRLGWAEMLNDPRPQSTKLRELAAKAIAKAVQLNSAWQEFVICKGVGGDFVGAASTDLLCAVADAIGETDEQIALDKLEAVCRETVDYCESAKEWIQ